MAVCPSHFWIDLLPRISRNVFQVCSYIADQSRSKSKRLMMMIPIEGSTVSRN